MQLTWHCCDLLTGQVLAQLPLAGVERIRRRIANVESTTFTLPVFDERCPEDWAGIVVDGKAMIVLTIDDQPSQAWAVIETTIGDTTVPINASTLEECLNRTNVPDYEPPDGADLTTVAAALVQPAVDNFGFVVETQLSGKLFEGTQTYSVLEDRKILTALNEDIMGADGGPEWRTFVRWTDDEHRAFEKVIEILPRVGQVRPDAIFNLDPNGGGSIASYRRTSSYAAGKGATRLTGTSEGSGTSRPMTDPQDSDLIAAGWPVWEHRENYTGLDAGSVADEDTELLRRTKATLATLQSGSKTWSITLRDTMRPGIDYDAGDTTYTRVAPRPPVDPFGGNLTSRVLGWELIIASGQSIPLLWENEDGETSG